MLVSWGLYDRYTGIGLERLLCYKGGRKQRTCPCPEFDEGLQED